MQYSLAYFHESIWKLLTWYCLPFTSWRDNVGLRTGQLEGAKIKWPMGWGKWFKKPFSDTKSS